jgi:hypothetical protein
VIACWFLFGRKLRERHTSTGQYIHTKRKACMQMKEMCFDVSNDE